MLLLLPPPRAKVSAKAKDEGLEGSRSQGPPLALPPKKSKTEAQPQIAQAYSSHTLILPEPGI